MSDNLYHTTDFYITAVLITQQFEIKEVRRENPNGTENPNGKVKRFFFDDSKELRSTIINYINGNLSGNLRDFRNAIEAVKDMVHSG